MTDYTAVSAALDTLAAELEADFISLTRATQDSGRIFYMANLHNGPLIRSGFGATMNEAVKEAAEREPVDTSRMVA